MKKSAREKAEEMFAGSEKRIDQFEADRIADAAARQEKMSKLKALRLAQEESEKSA